MAKKPKKKTKAPAKAKRGRGQPTKYKPDFHPAWAKKFALLGAIGPEIADALEISPATHENWKKKYPEYLEAIKEGGRRANAEVAERLKERAMGYVCTVEQAFKLKKGKDNEVVELVTLKQEVPPDTKAAALWLSNRERKLWKERQSVEIEASDDVITMFQKARERLNRLRGELDGDEE